ncbi:DivIVA domain-containing protein [Bradymonas sediminis]|nr:DivIVA domain-containing protein [Bradymonas sediminis]TDP77549.1 cell division initiation protein [Bradymonas sediminis]
MIKFSAEDIVNQTFETRFRGYDRAQVDEFLNGLSREFDHIVTEHKQARQELKEYKAELSEYRRREASLHDALNMARQVGEQIRQQSERDAELTIAEAELRAERMLAGVQNRVSALREEMFELQQQRVRSQTELRNVLESHLKMLDLLSPPENVQRSSISRAPKPPQGDPRDHDAHFEVGDEDIEDAHAIDTVSKTAPGIVGAS